MVAIYHASAHFFGFYFEWVAILKLIGVPLLDQNAVRLFEFGQNNRFVDAK